MTVGLAAYSGVARDGARVARGQLHGPGVVVHGAILTECGGLWGIEKCNYHFFFITKIRVFLK
jgi:hypothetical protein